MDIEHTRAGEIKLSMKSFTSKLQEEDETMSGAFFEHLEEQTKNSDPEHDVKYRSHVDALNWLTMYLRFELTYTTKELSRTLQEPTKTAKEILKRRTLFSEMKIHTQDYNKPPKIRRKPTDNEEKAYGTTYNATDAIQCVDDIEQGQEYRYTKSQVTEAI
jgi:hypothetical protein